MDDFMPRTPTVTSILNHLRKGLGSCSQYSLDRQNPAGLAIVDKVHKLIDEHYEQCNPWITPIRQALWYGMSNLKRSEHKEQSLINMRQLTNWFRENMNHSLPMWARHLESDLTIKELGI
jgi:hypothetical protein